MHVGENVPMNGVLFRVFEENIIANSISVLFFNGRTGGNRILIGEDRKCDTTNSNQT